MIHKSDSWKPVNFIKAPTMPQHNAAAGGGSTTKVQSSVTEFFAAGPLGFLGRDLEMGMLSPGNSQTKEPEFSSQEVDELIAMAIRLVKITEWIERLPASGGRLRLVNPKPNGACWMYAAEAAKRRVVRGANIGTGTQVSFEANDWLERIFTYLITYFPQMVDDGMACKRTVYKRYFGRYPMGTDEETMAEIEAFMLETQRGSCAKGFERARWVGAEEIMATVWYVREPVFVMSVHENGDVSTQMYIIEDTEANSPYEECVKIRALEPEEAFVILQTMLNHRVIPMVITHHGGYGYLIPDAKPALVEHWSAHFMAITCSIDGASVLVVNIYAQSTPSERETFFHSLRTVSIQHDGPVFVGGDFNCTQNTSTDRSFQSTASNHASAGLVALIELWQVHDAVVEDLDLENADDGELQAFQSAHHTYKYTVNGDSHSSRLDRWYVSRRWSAWTTAAETYDMGCGSDHAAVDISISDPARRARVRRRAKLYPPKACASQAVDSASREAILTLQRNFNDVPDDIDDIDARAHTRMGGLQTLCCGCHEDGIHNSN